MADPIDVTGGLQPVSFNVETNKTTDVTVSNATISILEMEDVLFHHDSAVMMPGKPAGASSSDGTEDDAANPDDQATQKKQEQVSGIDALALVFKESEFKPEQRLMVAGHTDTSGGFELNYTLSELRAKNVLYLVLGSDPLDKSDPPQEQGTAWAKVSTQRHKIEDYQQILTHFVARGDLPATCDPAGVTNKWDAATESACNAFFDAKITDAAKAAQMKQQVKADSQHKWPEDAWREVYKLYVSQLQKTLNVTADQLRTKREALVAKFNPDHLYVACGESYPIENSQAENYRSQKNRRVEILFLEEKAFENIKCPAVKNRKHKTRLDSPPIECPIWHNFIKREYVDPNDLYAEQYFLQFKYYNRMLKSQLNVPVGVALLAFKKDNTPIPTKCTFGNGVYSVIVQFPTQAEAIANKNNLHFRFLTDSAWIRTKDAGSQPEIIKRPKPEVDALSAIERMPYYDLPEQWDSRNWNCSIDKKSGVFKVIVLDVTTRTAPMVFCLDDMVLTDRNRHQETVLDQNAEHDTAQTDFELRRKRGKTKPFGDKSRVRFLYFNDKKYRLQIYSTAPGGSIQERHDGSIVKFSKGDDGKERNLLLCPPVNVRTVVFCGEFYDVTNKRTAYSNASVEKGYLVGARAAIYNDEDVHYGKTIVNTDTTRTIHFPNIGDFDVHYLHDCGSDGSTTYSSVVIYWRTFLLKDTNPTGAGATDTEVKEFASIGMENAMERWNIKDYLCVDNAGVNSHVVQPFYFYEANETLSFTPDVAVNFVNNHNSCNLLTINKFKNALKDCCGGPAMTLSFVVEETKGSWLVSFTDGSNPFSIASLRIKTRQNDNSRFAGFPFSDFGVSIGCLVIAHELGHATGQVDDYIQNVDQDGGLNHTDVPTFGQFGHDSAYGRILPDNSNFNNRIGGSDPYSVFHDNLSIMIKNGPIRMRHVWRITNWLNQTSQSGKALNKFLGGRKYKIKFQYTDDTGSTQVLHYFRDTVSIEDPWIYAKNGVVTVNAATQKQVTAILYRTLDETSVFRRSPPSPDILFKAILAVRVYLYVDFVNGGTNWTDDQKRAWVQELNERFSSDDPLGIRVRFYIAGGGGDTDPTVIYFKTGFDFVGHANAMAAANYTIRVTHGNNAAISYVAGTRTITLGRNLANWSLQLVNCFFNKNLNDVAFGAVDLDFLLNWYNTNVHGGNTIRTV